MTLGEEVATNEKKKNMYRLDLTEFMVTVPPLPQPNPPILLLLLDSVRKTKLAVLLYYVPFIYLFLVCSFLLLS